MFLHKTSSLFLNIFYGRKNAVIMIVNNNDCSKARATLRVIINDFLY